ncbi:MAG: Transcriptional regulator, TetR family [Actinobacteria bacterium 66_15]|nr:MAG: Transcriptional regulator, TetR family [Actinobacteria bacterium 66_15]
MAARPSNPRMAADIVEAAASLVEEHGPEGVTMRLVAERIGYSATTIYLYFKNKERLLDETVNRAYDWFADALERAQTADTAPDRIRQGAHAYVEWGLTNPGMYRLMFEWGYLGDISDEAIFARRASWRRTRNVVERGVEDGCYRSDLDSALAADTIWVGVHGLTSLAISGRMFGNPGVADPVVVARRTHQLADALADSWEAAWRA